MFILFEGLDLSGKSTLCRELGNALGWPVRHNTLLGPGANPLYEAAQVAHRRQSASVVDVGQLFLEALAFELDRYHPETEPTIQDSTILLRSIAYHSALGNDRLASDFCSLAKAHPKPALGFLCRPSIEVRLRRLEGRISRGNDTPEDYVVRDDLGTFVRMENAIAEGVGREFGLELLDTSHLEDPEARALLIAGLVQRIRSHGRD